MNAPLTAFWIFVVLTVGFAVTLLVRLWPRPAPAAAPISEQVATTKNIVAQGAAPNAETLKAIAESISTILKALGDFGSKLDTFGPTAVLGVFTVFFAICTLVSAWMARGA